MIRPAGILVPAEAGRVSLIAGFNQIEALAAKDIGTGKWLFLHVVDTVALVHAMILRMQALMLPVQTLVFGGH